MKEGTELYDEIWQQIKHIRSRWRDPAMLDKLLAEWEEDYGTKMDEEARKMIAEQTRKQWASYAASKKLSSLEDFVRSAWEGWTEGEFTIEKGAKGIQIYCTKCPMAEAYHSIRKGHYGLIFHCSEDPHMVSGFNPKLKFRRTKTLMEGEDYCNHFYSE